MTHEEDGPPQLTIDGGEVSTAKANATSGHGAGFTPAQNEIIAVIRETGQIRSVEAGKILHAHRGTPCARYGGSRARMNRGEDSIGCCAYASSDGLEAMKRLADRGLVERGEARGVWIPAAEVDA